MNRINDIESLSEHQLTLYIDDQPIQANVGESVLGVLFSLGLTTISITNNGISTGAYCGMGICYCCAVNINGVHKQRACQVIVQSGMRVETQLNHLLSQGKIDG